MVFCPAEGQTRHWRMVGNVQFALELEEGKSVNCVWISSAREPKVHLIDPKVPRL
jgi:hypothetical protein